MSGNRPFALTIAGLDPSGGAGILADVKTFEQHRVYGLAINTGNTIQTENVFCEMQWTDLDFVLRSIQTLFQAYTFKAVKIGITPSLEYLKAVILEIKKHSPESKIVWDPVLKSSTEFDFLTIENQLSLNDVLNHIALITPNFNEAKILFPESEYQNAPCPVLLKGGHNEQNKGVDYLFYQNETHIFGTGQVEASEKHGSGCVLSSAVTANLALEQNLQTACINAKNYVENILKSNPNLLGYHYV